jgi:predicted enzyme related to lactoylglutathione lyase
VNRVARSSRPGYHVDSAHCRPGSTRRVSIEQTGAVTMEVLFASVPVSDLQAATPWYEQLFGRAADIVPNEDEVMWCVAGNGWLYVVEDPERAGRTVVTISVSDLDLFVDELASRGIRAGPIEAVGVAGRKANSVDSDGNVMSWIDVTGS